MKNKPDIKQLSASFDEYLKQGEPSQIEKTKAWKAAIGMQQVDALKPSDYLISAAKSNIEGYLTLDEVSQLIENYYQQQPEESADRTEEADKVSTRIAQILSEKTFSFSPAEYLSLHKRLFHGLYPHAGKLRDYNITKKEWILNGASVLYASAVNLQETLQYDFDQEKKFNYRSLSQQQIIEHLASFVSSLWQIHPFGEGNTRTTAVFFIKYLHQLGFENVNNNLFAEHSWYFRNALVRANYKNLSKNIYKTEEFLIRFLSNLLLTTHYPLKNREMHVLYSETNIQKRQPDTLNTQPDTVNDTLLSLLQQNPKLTGVQLSEQLNVSLSTVRRILRRLKAQEIIVRIGSDKTGHWLINQNTKK